MARIGATQQRPRGVDAIAAHARFGLTGFASRALALPRTGVRGEQAWRSPSRGCKRQDPAVRDRARFCIVAAPATRSRLLLQPSVGSEQKLGFGLSRPGTWPPVRETRRERLRLQHSVGRSDLGDSESAAPTPELRAPGRSRRPVGLSAPRKEESKLSGGRCSRRALDPHGGTAAGRREGEASRCLYLRGEIAGLRGIYRPHPATRMRKVGTAANGLPTGCSKSSRWTSPPARTSRSRCVAAVAKFNSNPSTDCGSRSGCARSTTDGSSRTSTHSPTQAARNGPRIDAPETGG
jgi:hypothetical protein